MQEKGLHKIGEGNTSDIFWIDNKRVLKLFKTGYSQSTAQHEYENHRLVSGIISNIPKIYEYTEINGRFGFVMENVQGKMLSSLMMDELTFDQAMNTFTNLHKNWLMKTSNAANSYTEWLINVLNQKLVDSDLLDRIKQLPQGNILCHGDFHPYNIIVTSENKPIIIDFANICRGPKEYDIARTYFLLKEAEKPIAEIYLEKMQIEYKDIKDYIEILKKIRQHEMRGNPDVSGG